MSSVTDLTKILTATTEGYNLIEDPSSMGGILVCDEIVRLVADLETVADIGFAGQDRFKDAAAVLLQAMLNAENEGHDPFERAQDWINGWLDLDQKEELA